MKPYLAIYTLDDEFGGEWDPNGIFARPFWADDLEHAIEQAMEAEEAGESYRRTFVVPEGYAGKPPIQRVPAMLQTIIDEDGVTTQEWVCGSCRSSDFRWEEHHLASMESDANDETGIHFATNGWDDLDGGNDKPGLICDSCETPAEGPPINWN